MNWEFFCASDLSSLVLHGPMILLVRLRHFSFIFQGFAVGNVGVAFGVTTAAVAACDDKWIF